MRINEILTRGEKLFQVDVIVDSIRQECKPYLQEINYEVKKYPLYRGLANESRVFLRKQVRKDNRKPSNTHEFFHNLANKAFVKKFGKPYRNGLFASGSINTALVYGISGLVFPIGDFSYVWSPQIGDFYFRQPYIHNEKSIEDKQDEFNNVIEQVIKTYIDTDLRSAIFSGNEIMIWCNEYYWVKHKTIWKKSGTSMQIEFDGLGLDVLEKLNEN